MDDGREEEMKEKKERGTEKEIQEEIKRQTPNRSSELNNSTYGF